MPTGRDVAQSMIRRAEARDLDALLAVCRDSFEFSARWQGPRRVAARWWHAALASPAVEVWICQHRQHVAGLCVLVIDEIAWLGQKHDRRVRVRDFLGLLLRCPRLALAETLRKLRERVRPTPAEPDRVAVPDPPDRVWLEMLAVSSAHRGQGLARQMLDFCRTRALQLGRRAIVLRVETENQPARRLYETDGYTFVRTFGNGCIYVAPVKQPT